MNTVQFSYLLTDVFLQKLGRYRAASKCAALEEQIVQKFVPTRRGVMPQPKVKQVWIYRKYIHVAELEQIHLQNKSVELKLSLFTRP